MYTKAQERARLVNQLTAEHIHFDGEFIDPMLEVYAREAKKLFTESMHLKCDAGEEILIARQLIYTQAKRVNQMFLNTEALKYVPVDTSIPPGAEVFTTLSFTRVGMAAFIANYGTDFPTADVYVTETLNRMFDIGSSFRYSYQDLRRAAFTGMPIESMRADASRLAHEAKIDEIALSGDVTRNITGISNNPNVTVLTAGGGTIVGAWESATAATIKLDLAAMESAMVYASAGGVGMMADTLLLDDESYMLLNTRQATTFTDTSLLKSYLENSPYIKNIAPWVKLRNAGPSGVRRAIFYKRSPDVLDMKISQSYESFAPQQVLLSWVVPALSRLSGVVVYRPLSMLYIDGLSASPPAGY